jgi:hypothetical protein
MKQLMDVDVDVSLVTSSSAASSSSSSSSASASSSAASSSTSSRAYYGRNVTAMEWGPFRFTKRPNMPTTSKQMGSWTVKCCFHPPQPARPGRPALPCSRERGYDTDADEQSCIRNLKLWALRCTQATDRQSHMAFERNTMDRSDERLDALLADLLQTHPQLSSTAS